MYKRLKIGDVKPGMYVVSVERQTGDKVVTSEGLVRTEQALDQLKQLGILEVMVDPARSLPTASMPESAPEAAPTAAPAAEQSPLDRLKPTVSFEAEIGHATKLYQEAKDLQSKAFRNLQAGRPIEVGPMQRLASGIMESVFRNKDALLCVSRMREKDAYLLEHSINVSILMTIFARYLGFDETTIHELSAGALLHDIGKILVPDEILNKPGKLTDEEFAIMRKHVDFGMEVLQKTPGVTPLMLTVVGEHHERLDGSGYPFALPADNISREGRMIAIVDSYDAITASRVYKDSSPSMKAFQILRAESGTRYDAGLVTDFIRAIGVHPVGTMVKLKSQRLGVIVRSNLAQPLRPVIKVFYNAKLRQHIPVIDLDLSDPRHQDEIEASVKPEQFKIDLLQFFRLAIVGT